MVKPAFQIFRHSCKPVFEVEGDDKYGKNNQHNRSNPFVIKNGNAGLVTAAGQPDYAAC